MHVFVPSAFCFLNLQCCFVVQPSSQQKQTLHHSQYQIHSFMNYRIGENKFVCLNCLNIQDVPSKTSLSRLCIGYNLDYPSLSDLHMPGINTYRESFKMGCIIHAFSLLNICHVPHDFRNQTH